MQYTEKELSQLIKNVELEFTAHLAKAETVTAQPSLAKAEDEKPAEESKESQADEGKEEAPKAESKESKDESKEAPKAEAKEEAPAQEAAPAEGEAAPAEEAPAAQADVSGYDAEDIAQMDAMYMSMSKAELIAHHDSCVRALDAIGAEHTHAAAPAAAAPAEQAAAPAPEMDKCGDMSMQKNESNTSVVVKPEVIQANPELEIAKSEAAAHKAKVDELQKSLDTVQSFLTQLVKKVPQGKAITQYEQISKSETAPAAGEQTLSKSEVTEKLMKKAADPTLSKNDRDAINAYYLNKANFNTISHLLK